MPEQTYELSEETDEGWLSIGAVVRMKRRASGRWWAMTGVIDGYTADERYLLRDQATGERWLPKIDGGVLEILEVIHPGHPEASRTLTYEEAMVWKHENDRAIKAAHDKAVYEVLAAADAWLDAGEGVLDRDVSNRRLAQAVRTWREVHPS